MDTSIKFSGTHLYAWVAARARTRTARSGDERTNHEAIAPPTTTSGVPRSNYHATAPPT